MVTQHEQTLVADREKRCAARSDAPVVCLTRTDPEAVPQDRHQSSKVFSFDDGDDKDILCRQAESFGSEGSQTDITYLLWYSEGLRISLRKAFLLAILRCVDGACCCELETTGDPIIRLVQSEKHENASDKGTTAI